MNPNVVLSVERPGKDSAEARLVAVAGIAEATDGSGKCFLRSAPLVAKIPRCLSNLEMEDQCTAVIATQLDAEPASRKANTKGGGWQRKHHTLPFSRSCLAPTKLTVAVQYSIFQCAKPALQFRNLGCLQANTDHKTSFAYVHPCRHPYVCSKAWGMVVWFLLDSGSRLNH